MDIMLGCLFALVCYQVFFRNNWTNQQILDFTYSNFTSNIIALLSQGEEMWRFELAPCRLTWNQLLEKWSEEVPAGMYTWSVTFIDRRGRVTRQMIGQTIFHSEGYNIISSETLVPLQKFAVAIDRSSLEHIDTNRLAMVKYRHSEYGCQIEEGQLNLFFPMYYNGDAHLTVTTFGGKQRSIPLNFGYPDTQAPQGITLTFPGDLLTR